MITLFRENEKLKIFVVKKNRWAKKIGTMRYLTLLLFTGSLFATESFEIKRSDGSSIVGYWDAPEQTSFSITLILPGSQKESARRVHDSLKDDLLRIGHCALTLEKQGIKDDQIDEKEFERSLSLDQRLEDHLDLLKELKKGLISGWDKKISLIGQGDGGRIAAAFAATTDQVSALVLIASGGGWSPMDEALYSFRSELVNQGYSPQYIHGFLVQAKQEFAQALVTAKVDHKAFGYTHKYWESLLKTNLLNDLSSLSCPIYSVNGVLDDRIPIESVDAMAKKLEGKITVHRKNGAGREIIQNHEIYEDAISWLVN